MRLFLGFLGVATGIGLAAPIAAHADPEPGEALTVDEVGVAENANFLAALQRAGITYRDPDHVISAAQAMCGLIERGETGLEVIQDLRENNPGFSVDHATHFAAIAARSYCPQQLAAGGAK